MKKQQAICGCNRANIQFTNIDNNPSAIIEPLVLIDRERVPLFHCDHLVDRVHYERLTRSVVC